MKIRLVLASVWTMCIIVVMLFYLDAIHACAPDYQNPDRIWCGDRPYDSLSVAYHEALLSWLLGIMVIFTIGYVIKQLRTHT